MKTSNSHDPALHAMLNCAFKMRHGFYKTESKKARTTCRAGVGGDAFSEQPIFIRLPINLSLHPTVNPPSSTCVVLFLSHANKRAAHAMSRNIIIT